MDTVNYSQKNSVLPFKDSLGMIVGKGRQSQKFIITTREFISNQNQSTTHKKCNREQFATHKSFHGITKSNVNLKGTI